MRKAIGTIIYTFLFIGLLAVLVSAALPGGGDIVGMLTVPKTDQAVVYVEAVTGAFHGEHAKMDQRNKLFIPYVLPVVKGATVEFINSDELQHNVFGVGADEFNLGNWTKGITREHTFDKLGEITILCNVHPEMEAYILVLQNPYFARPDNNGAFRIAGVPPGEYVVKAWYRGKTKKQTVKVPATGSVTVAF
jgi:plastocyanin